MENKRSAIIIGVCTDRKNHDVSSLDELSLLADTAGFSTGAKLIQYRDKIDAAWYVGEGKAREIRHVVREKHADAVIFDFELSPVQLRNLERVIKRRVITRTEIILEIFEKRARTKEAKLQVELATLVYSLPRLRHMWPHLNRIEGGIGMRGPGEKQLEMDRRRISRRITKIKRDLVSVGKHRMVIRKNRQYKNRVALIGYTNAGKSSLLNALAHVRLYTESRLFATLDPATREVWLGEGTKALVTDTVGFIKRLPHTLIASFRATLEEVGDADILLHVVDISSPDAVERIDAVNDVLARISVESIPVLYVFNKADLLIDRDVRGSLFSHFQNNVLVSAKTGEGLDCLKDTLSVFFRELSRSRYEMTCANVYE
jgi:GTP-binding protein HflX